MTLREIDPLRDPRWERFINAHEDSSVFHSVAWLEALRGTYKYNVLALTTCSEGKELTDAIPFCHVRSWLTGSRLVSLPFTDHCQPLTNPSVDLQSLLPLLMHFVALKRCAYIELRPLSIEVVGLESPAAFTLSDS